MAWLTKIEHLKLASLLRKKSHIDNQIELKFTCPFYGFGTSQLAFKQN